MEMIIYHKGEPVTVLYDECDHQLVLNPRWHIHLGYVATNIDQKKVLMHRLLLGPGEKMHVDHKNRVKSDNRRLNLRVCTHSDNLKNKKPFGVSRYLGVYLYKPNGKYGAQIKASVGRKFLGYHHTEEEAARAYDRAARLYHGEFANPNFPE